MTNPVKGPASGEGKTAARGGIPGISLAHFILRRGKRDAGVLSDAIIVLVFPAGIGGISQRD